MQARARDLIERLQLAPHPEGGFYAEVHRSAERVAPRDGRPLRAALTSIYFLLVDGGASRWHRVASDEVWCHLEGAPVRLHQLDAGTRRLSDTRLAPVGPGTLPQCTVPAGIWQAAQCEGEHSLVACMVAPGFEFADFALLDADLALRDWLLTQHPALGRFA